jgi:hypothetical protein
MKVKELIEELLKCDQEALVYSIGFDCCLTQINEKTIKQTIFYNHDNHLYQFSITGATNEPVNVVTIEGE